MKPWPTQSQHDPILSSKGHNDSRYIWTMFLVKEVTPVETDYSGAVSIYMLTQSFNIVITTNKMIFTSILKEMEAAYMTKWLDSTRTEWELVFVFWGGSSPLIMKPTWRRYHCVSHGDPLWVHLLHKRRTVSFSPHLRAPTNKQAVSHRTTHFYIVLVTFHTGVQTNYQYSVNKYNYITRNTHTPSMRFA